MTVHLIKLSVGSESPASLATWQKSRLKQLERQRKTRELIHITRHMPKRAEEVLDGGSIYWVIKGWISARQRLLELRPLVIDGIPHCGLVYAPQMVRVSPRPYRAFQGWRYFDPKDAPLDLPHSEGENDLPDEILRELSNLGVV